MSTKLLNYIKLYDISYFIDDVRYHTFYLYNNHDNTYRYEKYLKDDLVEKSVINFEDIPKLIEDRYVYVYFNNDLLFDIFNDGFEY